jgi:transposase
MQASVDAVKEQPGQQEEVLSQLQRHAVQVLLKAGHSQADIVRQLDVSARSVRRIAQEPAVTQTDDAAARSARQLGRPSTVERYRGFIEKQLAEDPTLPTQELLRRAALDGYRGTKSPFYALVAALRTKPKVPLVRFEGLPGEFSQHDFGQVLVRYVDGKQERVHFFASRMKYSRAAQVSLVPDERVESLVRSLLVHFEAFGGVPLLAVFDRPRTIVRKSGPGRAVEEWNPVFAQAVLEFGVGVEMSAPRSGNQKGAVERLVGWVKNSFFKPRRFVDREDLELQLAAWVVDVNTRVRSRATNVVPSARLEEERARLRPLKVQSEDFALRIPVTVMPTGEVLYDAARYSMPSDALGLAGTLWLYRDRVRIVAGNFEAEHPRLAAGQSSTKVEHRKQLLDKVPSPRGKLYFQREQLLALGAVVQRWFTELRHRRPKSWERDTTLLFDALVQHGSDALRDAIAWAEQQRLFGAEYVLSRFPERAPTARGAERLSKNRQRGEMSEGLQAS